MPLNPSIRKVVPGGGEPLVNFDEVDARSGTGFVEYFMGTTFQNTTSGAILSNQEFYSNSISTIKVLGASTTPALCSTTDFEILFNKPQTVRGTALLNIPVGIQEQNDSVYFSIIHATIQRIDAASGVNNVAEASGAIFVKSAGGVGTYGYGLQAIEIPLPQTQYKSGETLRLNLEQWGYAAGAATANFFIGHDPKNRATLTGDLVTWGTEPSIATIKIPFRLDLP